MGEYVPVHPGTMLVEPLPLDGVTDGGILVQHHESFPSFYSRVLAIHPEHCYPIAVGDVVLHAPHAYEEAETQDGRTLYLMNERSARAVVDLS